MHHDPTTADRLRLDEGVTLAPPSGVLQAGSRFGPRYRITRLLGTGGMGAVYEAWDEQLDTPVALKLIRRDMIADPLSRDELETRLKRELLLARQVTHRNVVRIHDLGEVDGTKYVSMPVIKGRSLDAVLAATGAPLDVDAATGIARQILDGLAAVHEAGVVHRDLKPENVMVEDTGRVLLMDFGIARSGAVTSGLTWPGAIVGTFDYMAPEQAYSSEVDHRADLYSFGLLLYDMLAGRRARKAISGGQGVGRFLQQPAPIATLLPDLPAAVAAVIDRCLQTDPAARFQSASDVIAALCPALAVAPVSTPRPARRRTAAISTVVLAAIAAASIAIARWPAAPAAEHPPLSILVADLDNRTDDKAFSGALEEALSIGIEGAKFVNAFPRRDASRAARQLARGDALDTTTARLVSVREGIDAVLTGSIGRDDSGYALSLQVVDAASERKIAEVTASARSKSEVLDVLGGMTTRLRRALGEDVPQGAPAKAQETFTTSSLDAVIAYTRAQQATGMGRDDEAITAYREAIGYDPAFGRAYAGWAIAASRLGRPQEASEAWKRALAGLDRMTERERYRTLGAYYLDFAHNYEGAVDTYQKLVTAYPVDMAGHSNLALAHFYLGAFDRALKEGRIAVQQYPSRLALRSNLALYALYAGRFDTAATEARAVLQGNPGFAKAYLPIALSALIDGDVSGATAAYERARTAGASGRSLGLIGLADVAMARGDLDRAVSLLREGIAFDEQFENRGAAARKQVALAEALLAQGSSRDAVAAARQALVNSRTPAVLVPAARVFIGEGLIADAALLRKELGDSLQPRVRAFADLIDGEIALRSGRPADAVSSAQLAIRSADLWLARLLLARAYLATGRGLDAVALLEDCRARMGEGVAAFFDDVPTFRYVAQLQTWVAQAQQAANVREERAVATVGTSGPRRAALAAGHRSPRP